MTFGLFGHCEFVSLLGHSQVFESLVALAAFPGMSAVESLVDLAAFTGMLVLESLMALAA